jgi:hypothetical protein
MLEIPTGLNRLDLAFGNIAHMPKYETIPEEFKKWHGNAYVDAVSTWFFKGAKSAPNGIEIGGKTFTAKAGVDKTKALTAIKSVLGSFEPAHEHKEAACAYMLSEWFDIEPPISFRW